MEHHIWNISSKNIDNKFIGRWEIIILDQYGTQKSGTTIKNNSVHSCIIGDVMRLYSWITKNANTLNDHIKLDGNNGIAGIINEKVEFPDDKHKSLVQMLHLYPIEAKKILSKIEFIFHNDKEYKVIENNCVFDDIMPNADNEYYFPVWYYLDQNNYLYGLRIDVPINKLQKYVQQRDVWYVDCKGITDANVDSNSDNDSDTS